jgi:hypothetical protein
VFELRPFTEQSFSSGSQYNGEFTGRPVSSVGFVADFESGGTWTTDIDDQPYTLLGSPEVVQAEQSLIRMEGQDWQHLSAFLSGGYPERVSLASSGVDGVCTATIDLERIMPGAAINASAAKVFLRGTWAAAAAAGAGGTVDSGTVRGFVGGSALDLTRGFRRPKISTLRMDISADSSDISQKIDFDQDTLVSGLLLRQHDNSAAATKRADGIVKNIRVDVNLGRGGSRELIRQTWRQARHYTIARAGWGSSDIARSTGVAMIPLRDPRNQHAGGAFFFRKGDSLTIHADTNAAAELGYTDVTPAASDALVVTTLGFTLVGGEGIDASDELRTVGGSRPTRRQRVRRTR